MQKTHKARYLRRLRVGKSVPKRSPTVREALCGDAKGASLTVGLLLGLRHRLSCFMPYEIVQLVATPHFLMITLA